MSAREEQVQVGLGCANEAIKVSDCGGGEPSVFDCSMERQKGAKRRTSSSSKHFVGIRTKKKCWPFDSVRRHKEREREKEKESTRSVKVPVAIKQNQLLLSSVAEDPGQFDGTWRLPLSLSLSLCLSPSASTDESRERA
jgi:hypothetical protein